MRVGVGVGVCVGGGVQMELELQLKRLRGKIIKSNMDRVHVLMHPLPTM